MNKDRMQLATELAEAQDVAAKWKEELEKLKAAQCPHVIVGVLGTVFCANEGCSFKEIEAARKVADAAVAYHMVWRAAFGLKNKSAHEEEAIRVLRRAKDDAARAVDSAVREYRKLTEGEEEEETDGPDDRFDLWGYECNEKQEDEVNG